MTTTHDSAATPPQPSTWDTYVWPGWVPLSIRTKIARYWCHRGSPADWLADAARRGAPDLGTDVQPLPAAQRIAPGRYVHFHSHVGRVVCPNRTVANTWLRETGPWFMGWTGEGA